MPVPDFQSLMLPVLEVAAEGELAMVEAREKVAARLGLGPADLAELLPSGRQTKFANRIAWAKIFLERAGLVESVRRGVFRVARRGQAVLAERPLRIDILYLRRFPEYLAWRKESAEAPQEGKEAIDLAESTKATPEERIEAVHVALTAALRAELLERITGASWQLFEQLVVDLLVAMGYGGGRAEMARAFTKAGDEGLDGIVKEDALGLDVVYVQAKRWARERAVGRPEIQGFVGSLEGARAAKGVFVTTASFSQPARDFVDRVSKRVVLIDGDELAGLLIEHGVAVRIAATYAIKRLDEDYFTG
jgi:restriction system protein